MIKLQVIGGLGKDCVVNTVGGKNVINFSVAHTEKFKDAQGVAKEKTTWVDCAYWTDRTAISPYLVKGQTVYVEGTPEVRTYPKNDGTTGATLSVRVQTVQLIGGKPAGSNTNTPATSYTGNTQAPAQSNYSSQPTNEISEPIDDLPF